MIRVTIIAAHCEVRDGLATVLRLAGDIDVISSASSVEEALNLPGGSSPEIFVIDMEMAGGKGFEAIHQAQLRCPGVKTIALTSHDYPAAIQKALQAGAEAVIVKGTPVLDMVKILHEI
jgi:two-component system, NarL family, response regulator DesR